MVFLLIFLIPGELTLDLTLPTLQPFRHWDRLAELHPPTELPGVPPPPGGGQGGVQQDDRG